MVNDKNDDLKGVNIRPGRRIKRPRDETIVSLLIPSTVIISAFLVWLLEFREWDLMRSVAGAVFEIGCFVLCVLILCGWWVTINYTSYAPIDYIPDKSDGNQGQTTVTPIAEMKQRKRPEGTDDGSDFDDDVSSDSEDDSEDDNNEDKRLDESENERIQAEKIKKAQETFNSERWCFSCKAYKPPRCHHCTACGRCVLRSDHHCEFVGGCISYQNNKAFVQMIVYGMIGLATATIIYGIGLKCTLTSPNPSLARAIIEFLFCMFGLCLFFTLLSIAVKEIKCVVLNETTLERTVNARIRTIDPSFVNPYDLGLVRNFTQVFSTSPIFWILPLPLPLNHDDGLHFETRPKPSSSSQ